MKMKSVSILKTFAPALRVSVLFVGATSILLVGCDMRLPGAIDKNSPAPASLKTCGASLENNGTGYKPPSNIASLPKEIPAPGPAILYWPLATAPQLENTGIWAAEPIMISGASVYRTGEFLYQDFLYDDLGAVDSAVALDPLYLLFATKQAGWGTYKYPSDPAYANNAADILEVRVKTTDDSTAIRITFNSMLNPDLVASTIALGDSDAALQMPHGANASMPAKLFVTVHGCDGDIVDAATGQPLEGLKPEVTVDLERHQVQVLVPFEAFDPRGQRKVRLGAAAGLWDAASGSYLAQGSEGSAAFFNVAFRATEPIPIEVGPLESPGNPPPTNQWMEYQQSHVLATGDLSPFFAEIDFTKLTSGVNDDMAGQPGGVPLHGYFNRIHVSHFEDAQGRGNDTSNPVPCYAPECTHLLAGRLQPYSIYVPTREPPAAGYGLTLSPHGAGDNYSNGMGRNSRRQTAERGTGSISITMTGRNLASWWLGIGGAEIFEVWADVAAHYPLDPTYNVIEGGSMGGYASYKFAAQYPDLFARSAPNIPCPSAGTLWVAPGMEAPGGNARTIQPLLPNLRNVPMFIRAGVADPICAYWRQLEDAMVLDSLGYRYKFWTVTDSHGLPIYVKHFNDQVIADWLGDARVDRNPPHITYVLDGGLNEPDFGLNADHAYWVSELKLRDGSGELPLGRIDVKSRGFGVGDAPVRATQANAGVIPGGVSIPVMPYVSLEKEWGAAPSEPIENKLEITASNIETMTVHIERARVGCDASLAVQTDGPLTVNLIGKDCNRSLVFQP